MPPARCDGAIHRHCCPTVGCGIVPSAIIQVIGIGAAPHDHFAARPDGGVTRSRLRGIDGRPRLPTFPDPRSANADVTRAEQTCRRRIRGEHDATACHAALPACLQVGCRRARSKVRGSDRVNPKLGGRDRSIRDAVCHHRITHRRHPLVWSQQSGTVKPIVKPDSQPHIAARENRCGNWRHVVQRSISQQHHKKPARHANGHRRSGLTATNACTVIAPKRDASATAYQRKLELA
ncbi:MAG: hypothetical protein JWR26_2711 [Pedosphaera sp.]|nr:hypothetical protein [Pedosphaera sp.]